MNVFHYLSLLLGNGRKADSLTFPFHIPHLKLAAIVQPEGVIVLLGRSAVILKTSVWVTNKVAWKQNFPEMRAGSRVSFYVFPRG